MSTRHGSLTHKGAAAAIFYQDLAGLGRRECRLGNLEASSTFDNVKALKSVYPSLTLISYENHVKNFMIC